VNVELKAITLNQSFTKRLIGFWKKQFVLFGFAQHLASHFGKSFSNHSCRYGPSNDLPSCITSYSANSEFLMEYAG
jgi:hypothetical protein